MAEAREPFLLSPFITQAGLTCLSKGLSGHCIVLAFLFSSQVPKGGAEKRVMGSLLSQEQICSAGSTVGRHQTQRPYMSCAAKGVKHNRDQLIQPPN